MARASARWSGADPHLGVLGGVRQLSSPSRRPRALLGGDILSHRGRRRSRPAVLREEIPQLEAVPGSLFPEGGHLPGRGAGPHQLLALRGHLTATAVPGFAAVLLPQNSPIQTGPSLLRETEGGKPRILRLR